MRALPSLQNVAPSGSGSPRNTTRARTWLASEKPEQKILRHAANLVYLSEYKCLYMKVVVQSTLNYCFVTDCSVSRERLTIFLRPGTTTASRFPTSPPSKSILSFYFPHKQSQGCVTPGTCPPNRTAPSQGTLV